MADGSISSVAIEPDVWYLVFEETTPRWWLRWVGRFKHVMAIGWVAHQRVWLVYDVSLGRSRVAVLPDCPGTDQEIARLMEEATWLALTPRETPRFHWLRIGFWCVPAVSHLVGIGGCALRPDAFFRDCLRHGAEIVTYGDREDV